MGRELQECKLFHYWGPYVCHLIEYIVSIMFCEHGHVNNTIYENKTFLDILSNGYIHQRKVLLVKLVSIGHHIRGEVISVLSLEG